jgi:hypothetical protein
MAKRILSEDLPNYRKIKSASEKARRIRQFREIVISRRPAAAIAVAILKHQQSETPGRSEAAL